MWFHLWVAVSTSAWAMPLDDVLFVVDVDGPLAEVVIEQTFHNDSDEVIEAVYAFPLHEEAAVDGMQMEVGDRRIESVIRERDAAVVAYEDAIDAGYTAALTLQERPNLFTQTVGNIGPGERVRVRLRVVQPVPHVDGAYELVLPLVAAPRFVAPEDVDTLFPPTQPAHDRPAAGPPFVPWDTGLRAQLDVMIDSGLPFVFFESPSHDVGISTVDDAWARAVVTEVPMDRDFVLRWGVSQARPVAQLHVMDGHALLTLEPPPTPPREQVVPREMVWVIDQSCSMSGQPIQMVRRSMLAAVEHMDERDTVRILRFSDTVRGDKAAKPVTRRKRAETRRRIQSLGTHGGTYLLDGVVEALRPEPDPTRERMVMFLTDGLIGNETSALAAIADQVGDARLFAFGVGSSPNRWLLDEMARFGGGKTTWLRDGESPEDAVDRFVDTINTPVLTDIEIDWGDWEVESPWPRRLPALHAGQPLIITTRIVRQGTTPVVVHGRLGDGTFEEVIEPIDAGEGRSIPSTWARQKIANLERDQVWGEVPDVADDILATSLEYQVLSQYTAFLAVDRGRVLDPQGQPQRVEQPAADVDASTNYNMTPDPVQTAVFLSPASNEVQELIVTATRAPVDVASATRGTVMTREFLNRIPAGRSYQDAVQLVPGVSGSAIAGGPTAENAYFLDGVNITDPVTGTFSTNVSLDAIREVSVLTDGLMPDTPGAGGRVVKVTTKSGTNNLEVGLGTSALRRTEDRGDGLGAEHATGRVSGPVVRDRLWALASYGYDQSTLGQRAFTGHTGLAKITAQPSSEHRVSVKAAAEEAAVTDQGLVRNQATVMPSATYQWFPAPEVQLETVASTQDTRLGADRRQRTTGRSDLSIAMSDAAGGDHDVKVGGDVEHIGWRLGDDWASTWLGVPLAERGDAVRVGVYAQDAYKPVRNVTLSGGTRVDVALERAHVGPRAYVTWDPWGDERTKLMVGAARRFGTLGLPAAAVSGQLVRSDEWLATAERELVRDFVVGVHGRFVRHDGLAQLGGGVGRVRAASIEGTVRKPVARRWQLDASWRTTTRLGGEELSLLDDHGVLGFAQMGQLSTFWSLPTDPWTQHLGFVASYLEGPLGTLVPDPAGGFPNAPRWMVGLQLQQAIDVRKGGITAELRGEWLSLLDDPSDLSQWVLAQAATPLQAGWEGPRVQAGLRYDF